MGRAVDVSPWVSIAQWIRDNYMAKTREMIFTRFGNRQIHNGRNHYYADPGIRADHIGHVHWAMDKGGMVKPGYMRYLNRLRRRLRHNRPIHEDFSFPGMGRFADRYHEQLADKFYASHRGFNFDNSARTRKTLASFLAGPARNYRFADGTMIADEVVRALKPVLGPPGVDADTDKSGVPIHRYDTGGFLPQGLSMAYNGTGAPEPVGMGGLAGATIVIDAGLAAPIRGEIKRVLRQGAREHAQAVRAGGG
jgi:hypothetical protein